MKAPESTAAAPTLCRRRTTCRLCGGRRLQLVLALAPTPPANAFVPESQLDEEQQKFPLDVHFCEDCAHLQLLDIVDPRLLFENYVYVSGTSPAFVAHFDQYARDIVDRFRAAPGMLVVDIGSNDGTLLRSFQRLGLRVLGVDPAIKIAEEATKSGVETLAGFFTPSFPRSIRGRFGSAKIVTANNVFAHIDNLHAVVEGVRTMLSPDGLFVFEVSYLVDVYEKTLFDTIYHEHLAYHSVKPLVKFFQANGMELIEALRVTSHGGSLRGVAQLRGGPHAVGASVAEALANEDRLGLGKAETFRRFGENINKLKQELSALLKKLRAEGKTIAGFGAPAKATTLMHHFESGPEVIDFIVDDSPLKQGLFTPGYHVPVLAPAAIYERKPDYLLLLAWNFAGPIMTKNAAYRDQGGHFIVPIPKLEIH